MGLGTNEYYVRPTNGSDVAGQGTSHASAYQTINFAVSDIASTHGINAGAKADRINICDEASAQVTANVTHSSQLYGRIYSGYTSVAGDGGIAEIAMDNNRQFSAVSYTHYCNLDISGGLNPLQIATGSAQNVKLHDTQSGAIGISTNSMLVNCEVYNVGNSNYYVSATSGNARIIGCKFWLGTNTGMSGDGIALGNNCTVSRTLIDMGNHGGNGTFAIKCNSSLAYIDGCSLIARSPTNSGACAVRVASVHTHITNCLIEGWSGAGQEAIKTSSTLYNIDSIVNCAFYNNTSDYNATNVTNEANNETPGASLFVDLASDDFTPANIGNIRNGSYGALNISKGAYQLSAGGAAAAAFHPLAYN